MSLLPTAPFQESEVISNKTDKDGHHYLKVLLLSNKKTRNNWIAPYKRIGDLPKEVIDSFMDLPHINEHQYPFFIELKNRLEREGKSSDEILNVLKEESRKLRLDHIDHIFLDDPNSSLLYGQLKVLDKKENEFIEKNGRPSKNFTSPGILGDAIEAEDGTNVYDVNTIRAFHVASVDIPAFPEQEAAIKGVCKNGNSESCRKVLAVAGFDSSQYPPSGTVPSENVNNTCSCNKNIEMSNNQPQVTVGTTTEQIPTNVSAQPAIETTKLLEGSKNTTQEAIEAARQEAQKVLQEDKKVEAEKKAEENKPQPTEAELELKKTSKLLQEEREQKLEMKNFFLEKMLISAIPKENFQKEDEYIQLKESTKGLINKYGMSLEDADWLINKVSKSVPVLEPSSTDKKSKKDSMGVASWYGSTYNSDSLTRSQTVPQPASKGNGANLDDEDYPIF